MIKVTKINDNCTQICVDLLKEKDLNLYKNNNDWKKMAKIVYLKLKEMRTEFI